MNTSIPVPGINLNGSKRFENIYFFCFTYVVKNEKLAVFKIVLIAHGRIVAF